MQEILKKAEDHMKKTISVLQEDYAAIRAGRSVAVEQVGSGIPRVFGEFRLVKYLSFLLESYFPYHDRLCAEEGMLMTDALGGDPAAKSALEAVAGRVAEYRRRCFA